MDTNNKLREVVIAKMQSGNFELKPCPFCGGQPKMMSKQFFDELQEESADNKACIDIECLACNLDFRDHTHDEHDYYVRAFIVSEKWNRRAE